MSTETRPRSRLGTAGWLIVLIGSGLLIVWGISWFFSGPQTAVENIAERTALAADEFRREVPGVTASAFDVITIVTRTGAIYGAALGVLTLLLAWSGYRHGSRAAWLGCWVLPAAMAAAGLSFTLGGGAPIGVLYLGVAVVFGAGLLLGSRSLESR